MGRAVAWRRWDTAGEGKVGQGMAKEGLAGYKQQVQTGLIVCTKQKSHKTINFHRCSTSVDLRLRKEAKLKGANRVEGGCWG